jgi:hypothetical protein
LPLRLNQRTACLALRLDDRLFRLLIVDSTHPGLIVPRRTTEIRTVDIEKERPDAVLEPQPSSSSKRRDQTCEIAWTMAKGKRYSRDRARFRQSRKDQWARCFGVDCRGLTPRRIAEHSPRLQAPAGDVSATWFGRMAWQDTQLLPALSPGHESCCWEML